MSSTLRHMCTVSALLAGAMAIGCTGKLETASQMTLPHAGVGDDAAVTTAPIRTRWRCRSSRFRPASTWPR